MIIGYELFRNLVFAKGKMKPALKEKFQEYLVKPGGQGGGEVRGGGRGVEDGEIVRGEEMMGTVGSI